MLGLRSPEAESRDREARAQSDRQAQALAARRELAGSAQTAPEARGGACQKPVDAVVRVTLSTAGTCKFCSVCRVMGHGSRYCEVLLRRPDWKLLVSEKWFEDDRHNQYHCPSGRRLVDFSDEMHFSRVAMYLAGRQCLENKGRLAMLVPSLMPKTFHIQDRQWVDGIAPEDAEGDLLPWFVKEVEGNEGTFVECCQKASQCMSLARAGINYAVQQHVRDMQLYEGRKFHLRVYGLIVCLEDGRTWRVYTYKDGYLDISPNQWSEEDISRDTQVVIYRSRRIGDWEPWRKLYPKCRAIVAAAVERAVAQGGLQGRPGQRQFEITGLDLMADTNDDVWLIEFNMGPVLRDAHLDPECNDDEMVASMLEIAIPWQDPPNAGLWDFAGEFIGPELPPPASATSTAAVPSQKEELLEEAADMDDESVDDLMAYLSGLS